MNDSFLGEISTLCNLLAEAGGARPPSAALSQLPTPGRASPAARSSRSAGPSNDPSLAAKRVKQRQQLGKM